MSKVFAFDRDGTLSWGNPPGPVKKEHLLRLRELGYAIGGSGGQPSVNQYQNWRKNGLEPDFAVYKLRLCTLKRKYAVVTHVGNSFGDKLWAKIYRINYMKPEEFVAWVENMNWKEER